MSINLAGCIILDDNRRMYLLHRYKNGADQWELPGGKLEKDETAEQTAIRELREELGVEVSLTRQVGSTSFLENGTVHMYTWFLAEIEEGVPRISEPNTFDQLRSFSLQQLSSLKLSNNMAKLDEALRSGDVVIEDFQRHI